MSTVPRTDDFLAGSWVQCSENNEPEALHSIHNGNSEVEKLLTDAQKESRTPSSNNSPNNPGSPNNELQDPSKDTDWIWDFSSRPEINPPSDLATSFKRRVHKDYYSIRNSRVNKNNLFSKENLPILILTHASCLLGGVLLTWLFIKRYHMVVN